MARARFFGAEQTTEQSLVYLAGRCRSRIAVSAGHIRWSGQSG